MLYLIDHASHQGLIDMQRIKDLGHDAAIGKLTGEGNYVNPNYGPNHAAAIAADLTTGSYDWVEPQDAREPEWLGRDYVRVADAFGRPQGHLLGIDFETPEWFTGPRGRNIEEFMRRYTFTVIDVGGQGVEFYTGPYFMQETGAVNWTWLRHPQIRLWLAAPGEGMMADDSYWPEVDIRPFADVGIHQHQWHARDRAIGSGAEFDRNRFRGTVLDLRANGYRGQISPAEVISGSLGKPVIKEETMPDNVIAIPAEGKWTVAIVNGQTVMVLNFGGNTVRIDGARIVDVGVSVESATEPGVIVDRSFKDEQAQLWRERRREPSSPQ